MSNHSVIEHRANYHYVKVEEDYIAICLKGKASPHCKALILSILEQWTNTKRDKHEEPVVYMTYPQWIKATYWYHGRNVIIESLQELEEAGFITRKPYHLSTGKDTFAYVLNVETVQEAIKQLPEKPPNDTLPSFNLNAFKNKRVPNQTRPKSNGSGVYNQTPDAFNKERIISSTTQLPDIPSEGESNAPASLSAFAERKKATNPELPAITQEMLAEKVIPPKITLPSKQIPTSQSQVESAPDGQAPSASVASTAQAGAGKRTRKPKTEDEQAPGPPQMPPEDEWTTTICLRLFDYWRGAPQLDLGQIKYAASCAKKLAANYTRAQVARVYQAMSADSYWIDRGGVDVCDLARHMQKELNKLSKIKPLQRKQPAAESNERVSDFDRYEGNGPEAREELVRYAEELIAKGEIERAV